MFLGIFYYILFCLGFNICEGDYDFKEDKEFVGKERKKRKRI